MKHLKNVRDHLKSFSVVSKNTVKVLMLAIAFSFSNLVAANNNEAKVPLELGNSISEEIGKLLKNPKFAIEGDLVAEVKVIINEDNELVVLSVSSDNEELESFIKGRLNYKSVSAKLRKGQKAFLVPVRLTQKG